MKMKWSSSSSSLSSAGDRRSSTFYTDADATSNTDEMISNPYTSLESTILVPIIKSSTLPANPEKFLNEKLEFSKNNQNLLFNQTNKFLSSTNNSKSNNSINMKTKGSNNSNTITSDQLSKILKKLLYFETRLKNDQKNIRQILYEKDEIINRQWQQILVIKKKYCDETDDIENISIEEVAQYCPKCRKNYYLIETKQCGVQTVDEFNSYRERKISPSQSVEFASSSEEPEFQHINKKNNNFCNSNGFGLNTFATARRSKKYMSKRTTGTFREYLKHRQNLDSPCSNGNGTSNSDTTADEQTEIKSIISIVSKNDDERETYSNRINNLHGIKLENRNYEIISHDNNDRSTNNWKENNYDTMMKCRNDEGGGGKNSNFIYEFDNSCDNSNKESNGFEITDDWYASASDVEDSDSSLMKPYGYNAVNPVLECVNQILLQQSMDGLLDNNSSEPDEKPPKPSLTQSNETNSPTLPKSDPHLHSPTLPSNRSPPPILFHSKNQTLPRTKRVHFSTQNSMVQVPRNKTTPPPPPPLEESTTPSTHSNNSSEKSMKNSTYDIQSIYSNEYEPIGGGSENNSIISNYYIDMDTTILKNNINNNEKSNKNNICNTKTKVKLNPPDLPPKPPNLIKFKKLTKFNLSNNSNLNLAQQSINSNTSEPDYCSISEINEIIVKTNNNENNNKTNNIQLTVEAEVHKSCDDYSVSNNGNDNDDGDDNSSLVIETITNRENSIENSNLVIKSGNKIDIDDDDLNNIPKLPNVAEIITPTKKVSETNRNSKISKENITNSFVINQDNYVTKSIELKLANNSNNNNSKLACKMGNNKIKDRIPIPISIQQTSPIKTYVTNNNNKTILTENNNKSNQTINIIPTDKTPIQAEFDWYNLDAEYGKSNLHTASSQLIIPDVLSNSNSSLNSISTTNQATANSVLFSKIFDNCNIETTSTNNVEYNLDEIELNNLNGNSAGSDSSSNSSCHSIENHNQPDIIKKIQEFENLSGKIGVNSNVNGRSELLKLRSSMNFETFMRETTLNNKPIIAPRRKRYYYSGPFV